MSRQSSEAAEDVHHSPRRPSNLGSVMARKTDHDAVGRKVYGHHSKAKLQKLQEKVKVHQQYAEESIRAQTYNSATAANTTTTTTLSPSAASTPGNSMYSTPMMHHDTAGFGVELFMTPPEHFTTECAPFGTHIQDEDALFTSFQSAAAFTHAPQFSPWDMLPGSYDAKEPLTPGPSCSASDILTGFTMEDPFCTAQSLRGLHCTDNNGTQQQRFLSPECTGRAPDEDGRAHADTPDLHSSQGRVRHVIEQAAAVGFETLDEAIAAYYTETFEDVPSLYQEQRLSRNRRLPRLLSTLQSAAKGWSEWERRGFQEQIAMGAEELLVQELRTFIARQKTGAGSGMEATARNEVTETATARSQRVQND
ncbi:Transcription factor radR, partial [Colletotrichum shisoi]